jgi:UDP:flavonoid glycosyltransferase YjiC (YdhE family)
MGRCRVDDYLAEALARPGVNTRIAAFSDFGDKVRGAGCEFIDFGVSITEVMAEQNEQQPVWARNPLRTWAVLRFGPKDQARTVVTSVADAVQPGSPVARSLRECEAIRWPHAPRRGRQSDDRQ